MIYANAKSIDGDLFMELAIMIHRNRYFHNPQIIPLDQQRGMSLVVARVIISQSLFRTHEGSMYLAFPRFLLPLKLCF